MTRGRAGGLEQFFSGEHDCIGYLARKRWPDGFICSFCGRKQPKLVPALSVVCGYCRKQTSITARTILHGTRKSLLSWLRLCWLFCSSEQGISAREVQQVMALSSYQSSWNWLQKLRRATSIAEKDPCQGTVLVDIVALMKAVSDKYGPVLAAIGVEVDREKNLPLRFRCRQLKTVRLSPASPQIIVEEAVQQVSQIVGDDALVLLPCDLRERFGKLVLANPCFSVGEKQMLIARECTASLEDWLFSLYRRAVDVRYLQGYMDEFTFRWNRRCCQDKMHLFDELVTALMTPQPEQIGCDVLESVKEEARS